jgi:hypothetical protein
MNPVITNEVLQQVINAANGAKFAASFAVACMIVGCIIVWLMYADRVLSVPLALAANVVFLVMGLFFAERIVESNKILTNPVMFAIQEQSQKQTESEVRKASQGAEYTLDGKKVRDVIIIITETRTQTVKDLKDAETTTIKEPSK